MAGIVKDRWLHHTSFLWDFRPRNMEYLQVRAFLYQPKYIYKHANKDDSIHQSPARSIAFTYQMPERRPEYRQDRPHGAFLTKLKDHTRAGDRCVQDLVSSSYAYPTQTH